MRAPIGKGEECGMEDETINICSNTPKMKNDRLCAHTHTNTHTHSLLFPKRYLDMIKKKYLYVRDREPTHRWCEWCWAQRSEFWNGHDQLMPTYDIPRTAFSMTCRQKSSLVSCRPVSNTLTRNRNAIGAIRLILQVQQNASHKIINWCDGCHWFGVAIFSWIERKQENRHYQSNGDVKFYLTLVLFCSLAD